MIQRSDQVQHDGGDSLTESGNRHNNPAVAGRRDETDAKRDDDPAELDDHADFAAKLDVNPGRDGVKG